MLKTKALLKTSGFMFLKRRLFYNHSLYLDHNTLVKSKHKQIELKTQKSKATKLKQSSKDVHLKMIVLETKLYKS